MPVSPAINVGPNIAQLVDTLMVANLWFEYNNVIDAVSSTPVGIKCPDTLMLMGFSWLKTKQANWNDYLQCFIQKKIGMKSD